eukprot:scaffold9191_cov114-Isochrysis_galbana.AAC.3
MEMEKTADATHPHPAWGLRVGGRGSYLTFACQHRSSSLGPLFVMFGPGAGSVRQCPSGRKRASPVAPPSKARSAFKREVKLC